MKYKYIVLDGQMIMGFVELHSNLVPKDTKSKPTGGGLYSHSHKDGRIIFYGASFDFGGLLPSEVKEAWKNTPLHILVRQNMKNVRTYYSQKEFLQDALKDMTEFDNPHAEIASEIVSVEPPLDPTPRDISITNYLTPFRPDDSAVLIEMQSHPGEQWTVVFSTEEKLRASMSLTGIDDYKIKQIDDGAEYIDSVVSHGVRIMLDPWLTSKGTTRWVEVTMQTRGHEKREDVS